MIKIEPMDETYLHLTCLHKRKMLQNAGHKVIEASNGVEACEIASNHKIDLVIIDIRMPKKGGREAIINIHRKCQNLKFVVMSGNIDVDSEAFHIFTQQFGALRVLKKPFEMNGLLDAVNRMLSMET